MMNKIHCEVIEIKVFFEYIDNIFIIRFSLNNKWNPCALQTERKSSKNSSSTSSLLAPRIFRLQILLRHFQHLRVAFRTLVLLLGRAKVFGAVSLKRLEGGGKSFGWWWWWRVKRISSGTTYEPIRRESMVKHSFSNAATIGWKIFNHMIVVLLRIFSGNVRN